MLLLLPFVLVERGPLPRLRDWPAIAVLGLLFFTLFPVLFNAALAFTTAARGALALSTLPLISIVIGAALGRETATLRKTAGVMVAMGGVALALISGLQQAPQGAWRGDLLMVAAALCMALYGICSKPLIARYGAIPFTGMAMALGAVCLIGIGIGRGSFAPVAAFGPSQWIATLYLGAIGGAFTFYLWSYALDRTTPTRVAIAVTVNPISASLVGAVLLDEPLGWPLAAGIGAVFAGIWLANMPGSDRARKP